MKPIEKCICGQTRGTPHEFGEESHYDVIESS